MHRRLATAFASVALIASASVPARPTALAQNEQAPAHTGQRVTKPVLTSCPVHPEIKARSAGKCPKCRMAERKRKSAWEKKNRAQSQQGAAPANE